MRGKVFGGATPKPPIRTYNYKRGTVTDHRTGKTLPLRMVLDGHIEEFIESARAAGRGSK